MIQFFSCKNETTKDAFNTGNSEKTIQKLEEKFVTAKSGLNYRKQPKGEIIGKLEYGKKVVVTEHTNIVETINDNNDLKKGEWVGIIVDNKTVYIFDGYLSNDKDDDNANEDLKHNNTAEILLPFEYRDWEDKNPADKIDKNWLALYQKEGKYYLDKANYTIKRGYSPCSGDSTKIIEAKNKTLLFINDTNLKSGEITSINFDKNKICPLEQTSFQYHNIQYKIRAEGDIISSENVHTDNGLERYCEVENYRLYISINNNIESLFLEETTFNDTFVELLFVGDLDSDGRLDFIFEANRHYEEERVIVYLSSIANKEEIIKKAAEVAIQFDC